ncbi:hypothetical protein ACFE04_027171 [Oxalis oulophora]
MATCFRTLPMSSCSIKTVPSTSYSSSRQQPLNNTRVNMKTSCSTNWHGPTSNYSLPVPPLNPNDPFLSKLASVAASCPEAFLNRPVNTDTPPYLDIYDSPTLMASPAQVERSVGYDDAELTTPPPDLPSILLHGRIVYIGMPLVPAVTELVVAELLYLQYEDPKSPIYLYINSTGTHRDDGEATVRAITLSPCYHETKDTALKHQFSTVVGMEYEGFAIYDAMQQIKSEIHTVCVGAAIGQACLLLAAGTKGKRFMMPHAKAMINQPKLPSAGMMPASDVLIRAKEAIVNRDTLVELIAKHTGNPVETVAQVMRRPFYMDPTKAKEFGVIDKILSRGDEKIMADVNKPEDWDKLAGIKDQEY